MSNPDNNNNDNNYSDKESSSSSDLELEEDESNENYINIDNIVSDIENHLHIVDNLISSNNLPNINIIDESDESDDENHDYDDEQEDYADLPGLINSINEVNNNSNLNLNEIPPNNYIGQNYGSMNIINVMNQLINDNLQNNQIDIGPENIINQEVELIMVWANNNMYECDDELINIVQNSYLQNLQYEDESFVDLIRYTVRLVLVNSTINTRKQLVSAIFKYSLMGINVVFMENYDIVTQIVEAELKRMIRQTNRISLFNQMLNANGNHNMEAVKLTMNQEELEKIPKLKFVDIDQKVKTMNNICAICQDSFNSEDMVRKLDCDHLFHTDCIDSWLRDHSYKCPCCRKQAGNYTPKLE
jgi:hypothetical protein